VTDVPDADVVVVGAGPAGCAAALAVADAGLTVTLLDRDARPGWRIGDSLPGAAARVLRSLGAWDRFARAGHLPAPLKVSRWGSDEPVALDTFRDPDGPGWCLDRTRFERDLRAGAVARGARLISPATVRGCRRDSGGAWLLTCDDGRTLRTRFVIDCTGPTSGLLRPERGRVVLDRLTCVYQRVRTRAAPDPTIYTQAVPDGWWYTAVLPDRWRVVAFHSDRDLAAVREVLRLKPVHAAAALPGIGGLIDGEPADPPRVGTAYSVARSAAGQGWLAAGDSAIALDPLSSQGLFNALVTGADAGRTACAALAGDDGAVARYGACLARIWQAYLRHRGTYYGMERRWPAAPFWHRRLGDTARPGESAAGPRRGNQGHGTGAG
jgi:flavin-dependent dehydrogenase